MADLKKSQQLCEKYNELWFCSEIVLLHGNPEILRKQLFGMPQM
jgi:hypothetical protein